MKEINEAYDTIVSQRKNRGANNNGYGYNNYNTYNAGYNAGYAGGSSASGFNDVRRFIMAGRIADAEQILNGVPVESRNAEWYFLKVRFYTAVAGWRKRRSTSRARARWTRATRSIRRR